jgi:acetolactate synthase regulatory subunit
VEHTLHLELLRTRGALLRVLALIERRRFAVVRIEAGELLAVEGLPGPAVEATARVALVVTGPGPVGPLLHKLTGLLDVRAAHAGHGPFSDRPRP